MEPEDWPELGRFENEFVTFVNPCAVKGIAIFLALADAFPQTQFAAVPTWGTNQQDRAALEARPNVRILAPVDDINLLLARTRVLLVPSLWAEARSRIVLEALLRGVPVMAANVGGIPEAMMGVPYLLPVRPIEKYETRARRADGARGAGPGAGHRSLARSTRAPAYRPRALRARSPINRAVRRSSTRASSTPATSRRFYWARRRRRRSFRRPRPGRYWRSLSPEKRQLLALRLRKQALPAAWFPNAQASSEPRLFCFPHAGGGTGQAPSLSGWNAIPVRLPGRESRLAEAPFERMGPLVAALAANIDSYLDRPFAFFGHSMGAVIAFELARELRRRSRPLPAMLIASGARAPQFRRHHVPPPAPSREAFVEELRRLQGIPAEILLDPPLMRAILPALEADAALYRNYIYAEDPPLPVPVRAYGGADDMDVASS